MASDLITRVAKPEANDHQSLEFSKDPGAPIQVAAQIGTDAPPPYDRKPVGFPLSAMKQSNGGPWTDAQHDAFVLRLRDVRDRAVAMGFPNA